MADAAGDAAKSIGDTLQNWSNVGNLLLAFVVAGLVPLLKYIGRKYSKWKARLEKEEAEREREVITDIAKEVQKPLDGRMINVEKAVEEITKQNATMLDHMNIIEQLLQNGRVSFNRGPGRPSKHYDHSSGSGDKSGYNPTQRRP